MSVVVESTKYVDIPICGKAKAKRIRAKSKESKSLDIGSIAVGMKDAYYHFPNLAQQKDIPMLASNFAIEMHKITHYPQEQFTSIIDSYIAGYKLGGQQCDRMGDKEHKKTLANFYKLESEEGDIGRLLIFVSFKEEIEDFVALKEIKDIDDFNSRMERGELVWCAK